MIIVNNYYIFFFYLFHYLSILIHLTIDDWTGEYFVIRL
jgi:hypothetical protein